MRRLTALPVIIILSVTFLTRPLIAQQPTKEEMQEMQKMMQQMKSDPEMQKAMQQFGIDMKTVENTMTGAASGYSGSYYEFDEFQTPAKAVERIASIPKKPLTTSGLPSYLSTVENCVNSSVSDEDRKMVDLLLNKAGASPDDLANMASALWMSGKYIPAAYLMGKACQLNPSVTNLNNYSAFLVMTGGEELALPVLQKLNRENPKNSIILNNIGHWNISTNQVFKLSNADAGRITISADSNNPHTGVTKSGSLCKRWHSSMQPVESKRFP